MNYIRIYSAPIILLSNVKKKKKKKRNKSFNAPSMAGKNCSNRNRNTYTFLSHYPLEINPSGAVANPNQPPTLEIFTIDCSFTPSYTVAHPRGSVSLRNALINRVPRGPPLEIIFLSRSPPSSPPLPRTKRIARGLPRRRINSRCTRNRITNSRRIIFLVVIVIYPKKKKKRKKNKSERNPACGRISNFFFFLFFLYLQRTSGARFLSLRLQEVKTNNRRGLEERLCNGERRSNAPGRANADNTVIRAQPCVSVR